ncbi:MAG: isoprenyl transferase [Saprospirales bacterium]|nr:MAG: isoprenyl transferase [Saprospirales bacterium]
MILKERIDRNKVPGHVAVIMDGNGRWANLMGKPRVFGHQSGVQSVREVVEAAGEIGVEYLTLYAFSTENWKRPAFEVNALMTLLVQTIRQEVNELVKKQVQLRSIGDISKLPSKSRKALKEGIAATAHNTGLKVVLALNYSAKWDMVQAAANLAREAASGKIDPESIDEHSFRSHLSTAQMPDVELMIRTSGEQRISNFLLWELAYAELFFSPKFWPEFRKQDFFEAILDFQGRERRFGKTGQQLKSMKIG